MLERLLMGGLIIVVCLSYLWAAWRLVQLMLMGFGVPR